MTTGALALGQSGGGIGGISGVISGGDLSGGGSNLSGGGSDLSATEDGGWEEMRPIIEAAGLGFLSFTGKNIRAKIR